MPDEAKPDSGVLNRLFGGPAKAAASAPPYAEARVHADRNRCVQCGVCSYNCPVGISVRDYARQGRVVTDPNCVQCGQCIDACPRGTLRWGRMLFRAKAEVQAVPPPGRPA